MSNIFDIQAIEFQSRNIKEKVYNFDMKTTAERVQHMMEVMNVKGQTEFGLLCGASRSTVNQWLSGKIKNIDPRYGFKLEENSKFSAKWIILGEGSPTKK
jgi:hypothetical protein